MDRAKAPGGGVRRADLSLLEATLDIVDSRLEHGDVLLECCQLALENLPAPTLVGQQRLDAPKRLSNRLVFPLQSLQASIELIEVAKQIASELDELSMQALEAPIHRLEALVDHLKAPIYRLKALVDHLKAPIRSASKRWSITSKRSPRKATRS